MSSITPDSLPTRAVLIGPARVDARVRRLPVGAVRVVLGFPSPAEDFADDALDLNELLVRNPPATFLYRAEGSSMIGAGICDGDLLVVDRSVQPRDGDVVVAIWDGNAPVCKVLKCRAGGIELHSRNADVAPIVLSHGQVELFAVVGVARQMRREPARLRRGAPHVRADRRE